MLASVVVARALDRDLQRQAGLTLAEHHLLAIINEADPEGIRPTDLQLLSTLTKSGLTRAVDRLEALGLTTSRVCPTDARGQLLVLSVKGRQKMRRAAPDFFRSVAHHFADHLTDRETETLTNALERVAAAERA
jgi:DNA-binding MarR family transcriptional regulator